MKFLTCFLICLFSGTIHINAMKLSDEEIYKQRMILYKEFEKKSGIPWYELAAVDQYDRNLRRIRKDIPDKEDGVISVYIPNEQWYGSFYDKPVSQKASIIEILGGNGKDGSGDGIANPLNDKDILETFVRLFTTYSIENDKYTINYPALYEREQSQKIVENYAKIYKKFNRIDLNEHVFPVPINSTHSVKGSYGAPRGYGGRRVHEGIDIFAPYGVPVRSITYGIVEIKGWNRFGGWRIGIRDLYNNYHYYAHLGSFSKQIKEGDIVKPGTILGYVGSSGYGSPGTSGKFPPHLHYGIYKDNGKSEWSFDPYYLLMQWKKEEKNQN